MKPEAGQWYVSKSGQLVKVRLLMLSNVYVEKILIEMLDGEMEVISFSGWQEKINKIL